VTLVSYVRSLVRGWAVLLVGLLAGAALGLGLASATTPVYTAGTQLFVSTTSTSADISAAQAGSQLSMDRASSYAQLLVGKQLAQNVVDELGLDMTATELMGEVSASVVASTVIIDVAVTDPSAQQAFDIATAIGPQFESLVQEVEGGSSSTAPVVTVTVVASPELPTAPSSPNTTLNVAAGIFLGLALAAVIAVLRDRLDTSVRSEEDATAAADVPVLGRVPEDGSVSNGGIPVPGSPLAESFGVVETNLRFVSVDADARVLMVTSPQAAEGKTTTAINLARTIAESGRRVLLVDADLRRPRVTTYLGLVGGIGLTQLLTGAAEIDDVLQPVGTGVLTVLGAGPTPPNPSRLLSGPSMAALLEKLGQRFDVVIVDAPPLLPVADAAGLAPLTDGVLLCTRWGQARREDVVRSRMQLDRAGATTLGVILTLTPAKAGGYSYGYAADVDQPKRRWGVWTKQTRPAAATPVVPTPAGAPEAVRTPASQS
jgi:capsular exopolysaccharide synthesis family protein